GCGFQSFLSQMRKRKRIFQRDEGAQLGDSRLSPDVGYLLLHTLCPALYALVEDGLKPFQKDVITGQRKNSPWSVVEASVKTGWCEEHGAVGTSRCPGRGDVCPEP
uniref:RUN domain-containing protein n=1 Tax=Athene cunicularia TaxID=194338 RepID=A0A663M5D4_ATHCN